MAEDTTYLVSGDRVAELEARNDDVENDFQGSEIFSGGSNTGCGEEGRVEGDCCAEGGCYSRNSNSFSIQSGDIVLPPTSSRPHSIPHGKIYTKLFPVIHKAVRCIFLTEKIPVLPVIILAFLCGVTIALGVLVWQVYPLGFNINIESVQVPDHSSSKNWDAYQAALAKQIYNDTKSTSNSDNGGKDLSNTMFGGDEFKSASTSTSSDCCGGYRHQRRVKTGWVLEIVYRGRKNKNLLVEDRIEYMHKIEDHIYNLPSYKNVCHFFRTYGVCAPVNSLLTYVYDLRDNGSYLFPGTGINPDWKSKLVELSVSGKEGLLWYTGSQVAENLTTPLLRAQVQIAVPLPCFCSYTDRTEEQHQIATDFFISLIPYLDDASNDDIEVLYGGAEVFDYEVNQAKLHDIKLAIISIVVIFFTMFILTGFSLFLTIWGCVAIVMCWVFALFFYRVILQYETFSLLTIITTFVIIGIGVDDVFVFLNTFKQSKDLEGLDTVHKRITHTILVATSATFFTSATTTVAFLANAVSEIPAVRQFAIFTGLVVFFCFIMVALTMPLFLHIWHCWLLPLENFVYKPCLLVLRKLSTPQSYSNLPPIRMTELRDAETDSGIEDRGSDSVGSDSNSMGSDSHSSTSSLLDVDEDMKRSTGNRQDTGMGTVVPGMTESQNENETATDIRSHTRTNQPTAEEKLTTFVQKVLLLVVARAVMLPQMVQFSISNKISRTVLRWLIRLTPVVLFLLILAAMSGAMSQLKPSDHPPQFFDPDSNIQKMLDLTGNLTERSSKDCSLCSASYNQQSTTGGGTYPPTSSTPTKPPTTSPPTTSPPTTSPPTTSPPTTSPPTTSPPTTSPPTTSPSTSTTSTSSPTTSSSPPTKSPPTTSPDTTSSPTTSPPNTPNSPSQFDPNLSNNVVVYVVFGVKGVNREYSTSHVLPNEGEGRQAILNPNFSSTFTCPPPSSSSVSTISTTLRAMCRLCRNISNPDNGLVLNNTFTCFPSTIKKDLDSCLFTAGVRMKDIEECSGLLGENRHIKARNVTQNDNGVDSLRVLAMAFRSTTSPGSSAMVNIEHYKKWENFIESELKDIKRFSGPGEIYEGAWDAIASTFQTSEYWVKINTEVIAIRGSFYGILISIILCAVVVALLSNNGPVVLAMGLTILGILVTLLGLFQLFGWTLGIIEAVSLSILVGNSLDYCIHLSEGYMATDHRHLVFLNRSRFTHTATTRVKRVLSAISFIGVSILSSALTTILATLPLLAAKILLFTRFGQILILDTAVAIIYTLFFCATFLSLFGPVGSSCGLLRILNGFGTIVGTVILMVVLFVVAYEVMLQNNII